ncbi:MAG: rhodanese-like domain-containing protein, partial [Spirosomaceae bacterium]|nr:rhodanese-like domain-containing protein [Spirosomataceae bacterium]
GSACGKNMSKETTDTLGNQKLFNYALQAKTKEEFVEKVLDGLVTPPQYFPKNAVMNKMGYESFDDVLDRGAQALSAAAFEAAANETEALIIDVRDAQTFAKAFIPNSINIGIDGSFAPWVGALITDLKQPILLVSDADQVEETVTRLARVGYDNCIGYLKDGITDWQHAGFEVDSIESITAETLAKLVDDHSVNVLDVRKESEFESQHVVGFQNFPLDFINQNMAEIDRSQKYYIHCAGGYRSMIAASILKARGYDVVDVQGGFAAILESDVFETTTYVCPSTLL